MAKSCSLLEAWSEALRPGRGTRCDKGRNGSPQAKGQGPSLQDGRGMSPQVLLPSPRWAGMGAEFAPLPKAASSIRASDRRSLRTVAPASSLSARLFPCQGPPMSWSGMALDSNPVTLARPTVPVSISREAEKRLSHHTSQDNLKIRE